MTRITTRCLTPAVVALALVTAACGGGTQDGGVASIDGKSNDKGKNGQQAKDVDREKAALAFARCLRANGVQMPDPDANGMFLITPDQPPPDQDAMAEAEASCKDEREALQGSMGEPPEDFEDKALKMARCMREHGIDMPDPQAGKGGGTAIDIDPSQLDDPAFQRAQEACRRTAGLPGPGGGPGAAR